MFAGPIGKQMMIEQGYVPATCTMNDQIAGPLIYAEVSKGRSPCDGCNGDRSVCHGKLKDPEYDQKVAGEFNYSSAKQDAAQYGNRYR